MIKKAVSGSGGTLAKRETDIILDYARQQEAVGYGADTIKRKLLKAGYDENAIDNVFVRFGLEQKIPKSDFWTKIVRLEHEVDHESHQIWDSIEHAAHNKMVLFYIGIVVVISIIGMMTLIISSMPTDCGTDKECFLAYANQCMHAKLTYSSYGTTIYFESTRQCELEETVMDLDPDEPQSVSDIFLGRSMTCAYAPDGLTDAHILSLRTDIENCQGPLKDAIYDVFLALYDQSQIRDD
ncbi:hypothetical protein COV93_07905 [Candidatus Woesearchaeota archaeon CG11_big_fil_rev_8_21_14_0_20_43_8]|nr:MAG: hypothetical protein COV93_07905 [Candidatus Woesearchaeota archaeon CG11_big_fil_rev_8_21_14_0_20_43_8]PIO05519.1 MAG: hypothetical protein COT47_04415 [Candidatus Woesearchaeota archaeon CG08_land_8_20_14_0_20_43_7]